MQAATDKATGASWDLVAAQPAHQKWEVGIWKVTSHDIMTKAHDHPIYMFQSGPRHHA